MFSLTVKGYFSVFSTHFKINNRLCFFLLLDTVDQAAMDVSAGADCNGEFFSGILNFMKVIPAVVLHDYTKSRLRLSKDRPCLCFLHSVLNVFRSV